MTQKNFHTQQLCYINSRNRLTGTDSDFTFKIDVDPTIDYDRVALIDASIPKSYYLIQNGSNTFTLSENGSNVTVVLPIGNYSRTSFKNILITKLNTSSPNGWVYNITNLLITLTQDDGKFTYTVSGNADLQPSFIFTTNLYEQMGFDKNSTNVFSSSSLTSTNVVNFQLETTLFLRSDICQNRGNNILQNITSTGNSDFSYITYQNFNLDMYSKTFTSNSSNSYRFTLTDEDGHVINLNGLNIVMTVMIFKSDQINNLIRDYIKLKTLETV